MAGSSKKCRQYSAEYRRDAAQLVLVSGRSLRDVGAESGLNSETLRQWVMAERARQEEQKVESLEPLSVAERRELEQLRQCNSELEKDVCIPEKSCGLLRQGSTPVSLYRVIEAEKANHEVVRMVRLLGVSRSGYYDWRRRSGGPPGPRERRREALRAAIVAAHEASDGVNGAPRITADLRSAGEQVNRKRWPD